MLVGAYVFGLLKDRKVDIHIILFWSSVVIGVFLTLFSLSIHHIVLQGVFIGLSTMPCLMVDIVINVSILAITKSEGLV